MKLALSLTLTFLIFALTTKLPLALSKHVEQVLDVNGNPVIQGGQYYIRPVFRGPIGGGLLLNRTVGRFCPVTVLQSYDPIQNGIPVKFTIPDISTGIIFTGTPIEIEFTEKPICADSSKWLVFVDNFLINNFVGIGGPKNYPGTQFLNGAFNIQKSRFGYKLGFCVLGFPTCLDITRFDNWEGGRRLLTEPQNPFEEPFEVVFFDADFNEDKVIKSVA